MTSIDYAKLEQQARKSPEYWNTGVMIDFGKRLENEMIAAGLTEAQLSKLTGVSEKRIEKMLLGENAKTRDMTAVMLAFGLVMSIEFKEMPERFT